METFEIGPTVCVQSVSYERFDVEADVRTLSGVTGIAYVEEFTVAPRLGTFCCKH